MMKRLITFTGIIIIAITLFPTCDIESPFIDLIQEKIDADLADNLNGDLDETISAVGILDTEFDSNGFAVQNNTNGGNLYEHGQAITVDTDGRILVTGHINEGTDEDMALWRHNSSGTLDTAFNNVGYVVHNGAAGGNSYDRGFSIVIDSSGKILVGGYSINGSGNFDMAIWRYNSDGILDNTFDTDGIAVHHNAAGAGTHDLGFGITLNADGKILVTGYSINGDSNEDMVIWRYNSNGTLDTSFNALGYVVHNSAAGGNGSDFGRVVTADSNGNILVAGRSWNGSNDDMVIWRYDSTGVIDTSFNTAGFVVHNGAAGGNSHDIGEGLVIDQNGRILVTGSSINSEGNYDMIIWRYNSNGILDNTFNNIGYIIHHNAAGGYSNDYGNKIIIDIDGKILVTGYSLNSGGNKDMVTWRYNTNGTLDTTFNSFGSVVHNSAAGGNGDDLGSAVIVDSIGRILIAGRSTNPIDNDMVIWRYR
jgi:uncharacterized delta-60 repeat protein